MAAGKEIRTKISSIQSTQKITSAMEMVAASKMRKAQDRMQLGKPYARRMRSVIGHLANSAPEYRHIYMEERPVNRVGYVVVSTDRGLCGGLVGSLNRTVGHYILEQKVPVSVIAVGKKGLDFARRCDTDVIAKFTHLGDRPSLMDTLPISQIVIEDYSQGIFDLVCLVYARFVSTMVQHPVIQQLLPVELHSPRPLQVLKPLLDSALLSESNHHSPLKGQPSRLALLQRRGLDYLSPPVLTYMCQSY